MTSLPVALAHDTIMECVFEIRFSEGHSSAADLLPGMVFGKLPRLFKTAIPMPAAQIPRAVRDKNPQTRYLATQALEGPNIRMMFGPYAVAVSLPKPYAGWDKVKPLILQCVGAVADTRLAGPPERAALKYVNLLQAGSDEFDLSQTRLRISVGDFNIRNSALIRVEVPLNGCVSIVEVFSGTTAQNVPGVGDGAKGVMLAVDTLKDLSSMAALSDTLELLHSTEKEIFFGLLSDATLKKLGPKYSTTH
jgi:uncharacterized protein (TIGR04255 family)